MVLNIGQKIRQARESRGKSAQELGDLLNVRRQTINRYETGGRNVSTETVVEISKALGVSLSFFFEDAESDIVEPEESAVDPVAAIRAHLDRIEQTLAELTAAPEPSGHGWSDDQVLDFIQWARENGHDVDKETLGLFRSLQRGDKFGQVEGASDAARDDKNKRGKATDDEEST